MQHDIKLISNIYIFVRMYVIYIYYQPYIYTTLLSNKVHCYIYTFLNTLEVKLVSWDHRRGIEKY